MILVYGGYSLPLFKGRLGRCIVCGAMLSLACERCEHCHKTDELRCWKHHNYICPSRHNDNFDLRKKYLGVSNREIDNAGD